ncbi:eCIS core domain-containing protein [Streptomyces exfoliatus]|uniref:eCIS core domain-containing protein n=1 Tax=Streptomyces exfoliatus TaxID=1905 RepID=UPI003F4D29C1
MQRSAVQEVLRTPGRPLDNSIRTEMETRLGAGFADVRIHDDSAARDSAADVGARAYTSGSHIVIGDGGGDKHTLAHELTHVIQQRQGPVAGTDNGSGLSVSDPSDRFEREAEANATRVMRAPAPSHATKSPQNEYTGHRPVGQGTEETRGAIQRLATEEINPPADQARAREVPELSEGLVEQIRNATTATQRTEVLRTLFNHVFQELYSRASEDDRKFYDGVHPDTIPIEYIDEAAGPAAAVALTETDEEGNIKMSFCRNAFASPAILYSTIRHEFIHVAQRSGAPDEDLAKKSDSLIFQLAFKGSGYREVQIPMQEIETHVWELVNAQRTGIATDQGHMEETEDWLARYANDLLKGVEKHRTVAEGHKKFEGSLGYWKGYIEKTLETLDRGIAVMTNETHRNKAITKREAIEINLNNRLAGAPQTKRTR